MKKIKKIQKLIIRLERIFRIKLIFTYLALAIFVSFILPHYTYAYSLDMHSSEPSLGLDIDVVDNIEIEEYNIFKLNKQALKLFSAPKLEKTLPEIKDRKIKLSNYHYVTAYNLVEWQTDNTPCIGASGDDLCELIDQGISTCAANFVPLGTSLEIEGIGRCLVLDRLNKRYPSRIDITMGPDKIAEARQFGLQRLKVGEY
ncbi:3D domain-containing protein [bacterium]|nr:3D domain-containing protein [bacterium]